MNFNARTVLVAPCGIDCGICELHQCKDDEKLYDRLVERGMPKEKLPCRGCRPTGGDCPVIQGECRTYSCVKGKKIDFCGDCDEFPCNRLQPCSDRAGILPHNMKVFNLCVVKRDGVEGFTKLTAEFKKKYYLGKMDVGNGPQAN